jgi:MFS superfamily sulfate permease-like transporter
MIGAWLVSFPVLGFLATGGIVWTLFSHSSAVPSPWLTTAKHSLNPDLRPMIVLSLVLPQLALTLANSVVGTVDVAQRYFGNDAKKVTPKSLLCSIGFGNLISSALGGLPFCHGSGGLTAHAKGGARHWIMNGIIGSTLLALAWIQAAGGRFNLGYPPVLLSSLLMSIGLFHLALAKPTWRVRYGKLKLACAALAASVTHNMLWVLTVAVALELLLYLRRKSNSAWNTSAEILKEVA